MLAPVNAMNDPNHPKYTACRRWGSSTDNLLEPTRSSRLRLTLETRRAENSASPSPGEVGSVAAKALRPFVASGADVDALEVVAG